MTPDRNATLSAYLSRYDRLVEVGIGNRVAVAAELADRGRTITATDVRERAAPEGVRFVRDDVTDPDPEVYASAEAVYALNCPPELQRPLVDVAAGIEADCLFTTLGADPAVVSATPERLPGVTLFRAANPGHRSHGATPQSGGTTRHRNLDHGEPRT